MKGATGTLRRNTVMWFRGVLAYVGAYFDREMIRCARRINPLRPDTLTGFDMMLDS